MDTEQVKAFDALNQKLDAHYKAVTERIDSLAEVAYEAKRASGEAVALATAVRNQVTSKAPPPGGDEIPIVYGPSLARRVTSSEGSLTDVIGQLGQVQAQLAQQNKVSGIADQAAALGERALTFLKSRESVYLAIRLATLAGIAYVAFLAAAHQAPPSPAPLPPAATSTSPGKDSAP